VEAVKSPYSRWVFIPFMLISSYIFLNLVVGIIVAAMEDIISQHKKEAPEPDPVEEELKKMSQELAEIKALLEKQNK
jgi:large-conductance mechanosensitive channel